MNLNFNFRKNWVYLIFIVPYVIISMFAVFEPRLIALFAYSREAIDHFQYYRFITMFLIDTNIVSVILTTVICYYFFNYLSAIMTPIKQVILLSLSMVLSGSAIYLIPVTATVNNSVGFGFLLYTVIFFFAIITSIFLYNEELLARAFVNRYSLLAIIIIMMTILNGIIFIYLNMLIAASSFIIIFIAYYFTKPKQGYSI